MSYQRGLVVTLAELQDFYKGQEAGDILELMSQTNDILDDVKWMESNQSDGHLTKIRTGLPAVYWRRLYKGVPASKSQWSQVKEGTSMMEARAPIDVKELELYGDQAARFRDSENAAFLEAMRQKAAHTLFYGDHNNNPDEFNGLAQRYPGVSAPNVVNAEGTGDNLTSMWFVCWGARTVHGLYPKGTHGGLRSKDLGEQTTKDGSGNEFEVRTTRYNWNLGLAVRDWRAVVRVGNIDVSKLDDKDENGNYVVDLQKLTIIAKNMMPVPMREHAVWYMNSDLLTALEARSIDRNNVHLTYGQYFDSKSVPVLHGCPIRQCDVISSNEDALKE